MDLTETDNEQRRALIAFLLMEAGNELSTWIQAQNELEASGGPLDEPDWGNYRECLQVQSANTPSVSSVSHAAVSVQQTQMPAIAEPKRPAGASAGIRSLASFVALSHSQSASGADSLFERQSALDVLRARAAACRMCPLGAQKRLFWSMGPLDASMMFVAAGGNPAELDAGRMMTDSAAVLLDNIVAAMEARTAEARPERIYMTNVIKCACIPPKTERMIIAGKCLSFLRQEVRIVKPRVIIIWGEMAYHAMFGGDELISQVRGKVQKFEGIPAIATHHPLEMIRNANLKARVWGDVQTALAML